MWNSRKSNLIFVLNGIDRCFCTIRLDIDLKKLNRKKQKSLLLCFHKIQNFVLSRLTTFCPYDNDVNCCQSNVKCVMLKCSSLGLGGFGSLEFCYISFLDQSPTRLIRVLPKTINAINEQDLIQLSPLLLEVWLLPVNHSWENKVGMILYISPINHVNNFIWSCSLLPMLLIFSFSNACASVYSLW